MNFEVISAFDIHHSLLFSYVEAHHAILRQAQDDTHFVLLLDSGLWALDFFWALPMARAIRSYCTGISHGPVSASIANAGLSLSKKQDVLLISNIQ